jgi:hypothetical protein
VGDQVPVRGSSKVEENAELAADDPLPRQRERRQFAAKGAFGSVIGSADF